MHNVLQIFAIAYLDIKYEYIKIIGSIEKRWLPPPPGYATFILKQDNNL